MNNKKEMDIRFNLLIKRIDNVNKVVKKYPKMSMFLQSKIIGRTIIWDYCLKWLLFQYIIPRIIYDWIVLPLKEIYIKNRAIIVHIFHFTGKSIQVYLSPPFYENHNNL